MAKVFTFLSVSLFNTLIVLEHLFEMISEYSLHVKFASRVRPRKFNSFYLFNACVTDLERRGIYFIWSVGAFTLFGMWKSIYVDFIYV